MSRKHASAALALAALLVTAPAQAAKLGPYFPLPANIPMTGLSKETLLKMEADWLQGGLDSLRKAQTETAAALEKARAEAAKPEALSALEEKLKGLEADIEKTKEELALATEEISPKERQMERKKQLLFNVNEWIRELGRQATQQLKIAILKDGAEGEIAESQHIRLSELADALEKAKHDMAVENWAETR